ncbi:MAG: ATP-binding protein [Gemmatimonadota bacterium]|jgi:two-component system sensor histidine kinase PilS (NtrC family)
MADLAPRHLLVPRDFLRWLYLGRLLLLLGLFLGVVSVWGGAGFGEGLVANATVFFGAAITAWSFWITHVRAREPGTGFLYLQVLLDVIIVTVTVHVTGGATSDFAPLYILVISEAALLLPLSGGVLMGVMASAFFFGDIVLLKGQNVDPPLALQLLLFTAVAVATGLLGDRLRRAGIQLGAVESELRQLRLDTSEILDTLSTGILTVDGEGRLAYLNEAGARMLGVEGEAPPGIPIQELLEATAPSMGRLVLQSVQERVPVLRFKTGVERGGDSLVLGVSTTVMPRDDDQPPSATAVFQDITHSERMGLLDRRNQRLEAVAELSASLAHEIKNPLASIRSSVEQLSGDDLEPEDRYVLQRLVLSESDRLSRLLSEFLEFSGLRKGETQRVDLAGVVADAVRLAEAHPEVPDGADVLLEVPPGPIHIPGDSDLLHRAVYNLVLNALQFAGPGGSVQVTLSDARTRDGVPDPVAAERPVRLTVRDSGPGIPDGETGRIFDPFFTTRSGGSGLGLAVVHRAVEAHQGLIMAGNGDGGGAEFVLHLPADETAAVPV